LILPDVNVLVYALRRDTVDHERAREWLEQTVNAPEPFALCDQVLSSVVRIVTHPRIFTDPDPVDDALHAVGELRSRDNAVDVAPGPRHWALFADLCRAVNVKGNLVPDAWLAALAIESGCTLVTTDGDFARFPHLRVERPWGAHEA
jgi:hypothetical protein